MKLVIAEKPSVAQSIAKVIGADEKKDSYLEGNGWLVSWCVGHLLEPAAPERYSERFRKWRQETLPIMPEEWKYDVKPEVRERGYEGMIVFQSSSEDYAFEAYQVDAIHYLLKPVSQERFFAAVDKAVAKMQRRRKDRNVQEADGQFVWPDRDSVPEERQIYGHSVWFLIDTLRTKWNSRKNG